MTNKEDGDTTQDRNPRMAALLAVHLVSQVLDEAYDIANAARDSGQPWNYLSLLKSFKLRSDTQDDSLTFKASKEDCDGHENKIETVANVATSTPQRVPREVHSDEVETPISRNDACLIGQGDEDLDMHQNELGTSTLINRLFDMSDVEREVLPDPTNSATKIAPKPADNYLVSKVMQEIFGSYMGQQNINSYSLIQLDNTVLPDVTLPNVKVDEEHSIAETPKVHDSDYSFLSDAYGADINRDVAFYIDDDTPYLEKDTTYIKTDDGERNEHTIEKEGIKQFDSMQTQEMNIQEAVQKNVALYEDAYATLNRDYDQGSEDGFPILQDPKGMVMQEVELMTANTSEDDIVASYSEVGQTSVRETVSKRDMELPSEMLAASSGYKRNTLTKRFRTQGSRLLSCFRGMWRRSTGKSENYSCSSGLSPEVRHRTSSLVTKSNQRAPSPLPWKYKTFNEVMLRTGQLKEYTRVGMMQSSNIKTSFVYDTVRQK